MRRLSKIINKTLSIRLSIIVVFAMAILLMASLATMLTYSRRALKHEAVQKASQTLEATVQRIDNILLSVEQTTGNFYFSLLPHLYNIDELNAYCRELVKSSPYVTGCAIAFKPGCYNEHKYFMSYVHRAVSVLSPDANDNEELVEETLYDGEYMGQTWFAKPMKSTKPGWQQPMTGDEEDEIPIVTFCLPIPGPDNIPIGVMGVGVSMNRLSSIISEAKPSANSYCTLLDSDGSFIVHPNSSRLLSQSTMVLTDQKANPAAKQAVEAMLSGETGYKPFRMNGTDYYVFYKPYRHTAVTGRIMETLSWSVGLIYPEKDIFGDYNNLLWYVLTIAFVGLLISFLFCRSIIHRQLQPLNLLTASAQRIAEGRYGEPIPNSRHHDEIGQLQDNFKIMQQSLADNIGALEQMTTTLQNRAESLNQAYKLAQKADRIKTAFLHNMTKQMVAPAIAIDKDVTVLVSDIKEHVSEQASAQKDENLLSKRSNQLVEDIRKNGNAIADLLKNLLNISISDEEILRASDNMSQKDRKEGDNV